MLGTSYTPLSLVASVGTLYDCMNSSIVDMELVLDTVIGFHAPIVRLDADGSADLPTHTAENSCARRAPTSSACDIAVDLKS